MAFNWGEFAKSKAGQTAISGGINVIGGYAAGKAQDKSNKQANEIASRNSDRDYEIALLNDQRNRQQAAFEASQLNPLAQWEARAKAALVADIMSKGGITSSFDNASGQGSFNNPLANLSPEVLQLLSSNARANSEYADFRTPLAQLNPNGALADPTTLGYGEGEGQQGHQLAQQFARGNPNPQMAGARQPTQLAQSLAPGQVVSPKGGPVAPNSDGQGNPIPVTFTKGADGLLYHPNGIPVNPNTAAQSGMAYSPEAMQGYDPQRAAFTNTAIPDSKLGGGKSLVRGDMGEVKVKGRSWWKNAALIAGGVGLTVATGGIASPVLAGAVGAGGGAALGGAASGSWKGAALGALGGGVGGYMNAGNFLNQGSGALASTSRYVDPAMLSSGYQGAGQIAGNIAMDQGLSYGMDYGTSLLAKQMAERARRGQQGAGYLDTGNGF